MKNKVIAVVGATASGKTAYAVELAKNINGEIISADSRLVYKGMDIGTAKPSLEERQGIPHYMIDIVEPECEFSAGLWAKQAKECLNDILARGKTPVVAGGTGLYFKILLENYNLPDIEPDWNLPSDDSAFVEQNDKKKAIRYIEVLKSTGKTLRQSRGKGDVEYDVEWIGLNFPREELYQRINKRVDLMMKAGLVEETEKLIKKHGKISNIVDTIGYREIIAALDGKVSMAEAVEKLKQNTRNYAKRQLTWFRKNLHFIFNCAVFYKRYCKFIQ